MKKINIDYDYVVRSIGVKDDPAYEAYIPAFNAYVYGANQAELEEGLDLSISECIRLRKKRKEPIPLPEKNIRKSGKLILRINPSTHQRLALAAQAQGMSLNRYIEQKVSV